MILIVLVLTDFQRNFDEMLCQKDSDVYEVFCIAKFKN